MRSRLAEDSGRVQANEDSSIMDEVIPLLSELTGQLFPSLTRKQVEGRAVAKKLTAAMLTAGPHGVCQMLIRYPNELTQLLMALTQCFVLDHEAAPLVVRTHKEGGIYTAGRSLLADVSLVNTTGSRTLDGKEGDDVVGGSLTLPLTKPDAVEVAPASGSLEGGTSRDTATDTAAPRSSSPAVVVLPRMPLGCLYITNQPTYEDLSGVARTLGWLARREDEEKGGGANLYTVVEALVSHMHQAVIGGEATTRESPGWQVQVAAVAAVAHEVLYGASGDWSPACEWTDGEQGVTERDHGHNPGVPLDRLVLSLLDEYTQPEVWHVPTHGSQLAGSDGSGEEQAGSAPLTPLALACNALMLRVLLEGVGVAGRVMKDRFTSSGRHVLTVLMPTLQRLADPCPLVAAAADVALTAICVYGGLSSLHHLVAVNVDYVIDGLCSQLRQLDLYPQAPLLMAVLLKKCGAQGGLFIALAEPLRAALQGVSILARRRNPGFVASFLQVLLEVVHGAEQDALLVREEAQREVEKYRERVKENDKALNSTSSLNVPPEDSSSSEVPTENPSSTMEEVKEYFMQQWQEAEGQDPEAPGSKLRMTEGEVDALELRRSRTLALANVCDSAGDAAGPLMVSKDLRHAMLACDVCEGAVKALANTTQATEIDTQLSEEVAKQPGLGIRPTLPECPKVLPLVHLLWRPLLQVLREDSRTPLVERCLLLLAELTRVSGGLFLSRRYQEEAWPVLVQRMRHGAPTISQGLRRQQYLEVGSPIEADRQLALPSSAVARTRVAVLESLVQTARGPASRQAIKGMVWTISVAVVPFLGSQWSSQERSTTQQLVLLLAEVDADAVWLLLYDMVLHCPSLAPKLRRQRAPHPDLPQVDELMPLLTEPNQSHPEAARLAKALGPDIGPVAAALLERVEAMAPSWHQGTRMDDVEDV